MLTTLKNGRLTVTADTRGAELQTIDKDGGPSYLWSGDPAFWAFHAPTLFPIIGALRGGRALSAGGEISLPKHGFCRTAEFALEDAGDTFVTYRLTDSDATRKGYPFAFCLRVRYTLEGDSVETRYTVTNRSEQDMPFFIGGHPAFRVPLSEGETLEDYLDKNIFAEAKSETAEPDETDMQGFEKFLERYKATLPVEKSAVETLK